MSSTQSFFNKKKSCTIVLIGDHGSHKAEFLTLLHAVLIGKTAERFSEPEVSITGSGVPPFYTVECPDGTSVNILDTPELSSAKVDSEIEGIKQALRRLKTVDAFIVVADSTKTTFGSGVAPVLDMIFSVFPRPAPVRENVCFVFIAPDGWKSPSGYKQEDVPKWAEKQHFSPIINIVQLQKDNEPRMQRLTRQLAEVKLKASKPEFETTIKELETAIKELEEDFRDSFNRTVKRLRDLFKYIDEHRVQAWEPKHLYRRAVAIESELFDALATGAGGGAGQPIVDNDAQKVNKLVDEYCLLAAAPDFMTHLDLVIELLRINQGISWVDTNTKKLEGVRTTLQGLKDDSQNYPKGFTIS